MIEIENGDDAPMVLAATFDRIKYPARGSDGGKAGAVGCVRLRSGQELKGMGRQTVPAGDRLIVETPGGGGIGDPKKRARAAVARMSRTNCCPAESARPWTADDA